MNEVPDNGLRLKGVDFTWPSSGIHSCRNVSLNLHPGEIRALVGENGAGKTTLAQVLAGAKRPDRGILIMNGNSLDLGSRKPGPLEGIGMVRQRSIWPPSLKVWEAAALGREGRPGAPRRSSAWRRLITHIAERYALPVDPDDRIGRLNSVTLQQAELAAALIDDPRLLILDEPVFAWEEGHRNDFFVLIKRFRSEGRSVLWITHKLGDVFHIADRVTVLRQGRLEGDWAIGEIDARRIVPVMFDDHVKETPDGERSFSGSKSPECLRLDKICLSENGLPILKDVSLKLRSGEILAVAGLRKEGLAALEDVLSGTRAPEGGSLSVNGTMVSGGDTSRLRRLGMAYVPADRIGRGASMDSTVRDNILLLEARTLSRYGWLSPKRARSRAEQLRREGEIEADIDQRLEELSGGNIQKVLLQREIGGDSPLLILAEPSWGLDERGRERLHVRLMNARGRGAAVLLLMTDPEEAWVMADKLAVLSGGQLTPIRPIQEWNHREVTETMIGGGP